jgi:hypothetical protein
MDAKGKMVTLSESDVALLVTLLDNACNEVDASVEGEPTIFPDDGFSLMDHYDRAKQIKARLLDANCAVAD